MKIFRKREEGKTLLHKKIVIRLIIFLKCFLYKNKKKEFKNINKIYFINLNNNWVLGKIINSIAREINIDYEIIKPNQIKKISGGWFFFDHYLPYLYAHYSGIVPSNKSFVWFTHPRDCAYSDTQVLNALNQARHIFSQSEEFSEVFLNNKISNVSYHPGGADEMFNLFQFDDKDKIANTVLISSNFYPRKNAKMYMRVAQRMPDYKFIFLGSGWHFMSKFKNCEIVETTFDQYSKIYCRANIYLSLSHIEGGPLSVLEAINSGLNIVISKTGLYKFISDLNNVIVVNNNLDEIITAIINSNNRKKIQFSFFNWNIFGRQIAHKIEEIINYES